MKCEASRNLPNFFLLLNTSEIKQKNNHPEEKSRKQNQTFKIFILVHLRNFTFAMITSSFMTMTSGVNDIMCVEKRLVAKRGGNGVRGREVTSQAAVIF